MQRVSTFAAPRALLSLALLALAATAAQAVGRAEVQFVDPQQYTDAGFDQMELERTQRVLTAHFERLAKRLPDGQVLRVQLHDIDLAGVVDNFSVHSMRMMGRLPDRPRLSLRYELLDGARVLRAGDEVLTDLGYLTRGVGPRQGKPLEHERRLLDRWFAAQVAPQ